MSERPPTESLGNAAQEAARLLDAIGEWLAVRANAEDNGGSWVRWSSEHIATGAAECRICPLCRLIAATRAAGPEVAGHADEALRSISAALHALADAMGTQRGSPAGPDKGFQTIVIN